MFREYLVILAIYHRFILNFIQLICWITGTIEKALLGTAGVVSAEISLLMNSATIDIGDSSLKAPQIIQIIEDIGFDASLLEINNNIIANSENQNDSSDASNQRKLMLEFDESDLFFLNADNGAAVLDALLKQVGVLEASYSGVLRDSDTTHFQVTIDERIIGPRALVSMLECSFGIQATVASVGGFMMAGRMLKLQRKEQRMHFIKLVIVSALTIPILIIAMALPLNEDAMMFLDTPLTEGLNIYGFSLFILASVVQWWSGWSFHRKAFISMCSGTLGMDFLISSGTIAAYTFSLFGLIQGIVHKRPRNEDVEFFETAAVLIAVVILGKYLECHAKGQTAAAVHKLTNLRATHARLITGSEVSRQCCGDNDIASLEFNEEESHECVTPDLSIGSVGVSQDTLIDATLLQKGDIIRLVEGESVPADGVLISNSVSIDESMLTGESRLIGKKVNDVVYGGSLVVEGSGEMIVTACGDSSTLGRIVSSVQAAQGSKPPIQDLADKVALYFVPAVAAFSACTFIVWLVAGATGVVPAKWFTEKNPDGNFALFAFVFALAVWVSACPCAFGLATPTAILVSTGIAARLGILIRKGAALQFAAEVKNVVFDKTGTLTLGQTAVADFVVIPDPDVDDTRHLLELLLAAESASSHPLAKGISEYCSSQLKEMDGYASNHPSSPRNKEKKENKNQDRYQITVVPGQGIKLTINIDNNDRSCCDDVGEICDEHLSNMVLVGSQDLLDAYGVIIPEEHLATAAGFRVGGKVALFMAAGRVLRVIIGVSDMVRPDAAAVVATLKSQGVQCYMVTGDQRATALAIAQTVGIPSSMVFAGAKPEEKEKFIFKLQQAGKKVAFIGDGTNDSPALARANVGFAMAGGTDIAIEAGDIVLCRNDLTSMVTAMHLARTTMQRIRMNYFWALLYNTVLIPVSAGVLYPSNHFALMPMLAAAAMALSSVSIILSSLCLLIYSPPRLRKVKTSNVTPGKKSDEIPEPTGDSVIVRLEPCDCPASLAPVLLDQEGLLYRISIFFEILYYSVMPRSREDPSINSPSHITSSTGDQETKESDELENGESVSQKEKLTDVERFLRYSVSTNSSASTSNGRLLKEPSFSYTNPSAHTSSSTLRKRGMGGLQQRSGVGCGCSKHNCRCVPQV